MVYTLLAVMIVGFIVLIALFVTRFPDASGSPSLTLPERIELPPEAVPEAFTTTAEWYAIVTRSGQILVYNRTDGALIKTISITGND